MILRENINQIWASLIVEECVRNGAVNFFLAPGARCTPLTLAVAKHPDAKSFLHFDERGLGYAALGYARATGRPGVVITTSGTAVSNLHPAVVEAGMDSVPMLLLTADRPPELRDTGANQAIDQVHHFGSSARWFFDLPCPDTAIPPSMPLSALSQAFFQCRRGPVHLNCMFREPLAPLPDRTDVEAYLAPVGQWYRGHEPWTICAQSPRRVHELDFVAVAELFHDREKALVIVGGGLTEAEALAVSQLADVRGWPVISDVTSGLHFGPQRDGIVRHVDALLDPEGFPEELRPDLVLQFGPRFLSKDLLDALGTGNVPVWIQVTPREERMDPGHNISHRICTEIDQFCFDLEREAAPVAASGWKTVWLKADERAEKNYCQHLDQSKTITEPGVARSISRHIPNLNGLVLGASMPVRDMNLFAARNPNHIHVAANRGASGIDGTLATAAGFALGLQQGVTVLLGDLASLHDLNSLALIRQSRFPVVAVIVNNQGGGIFHFLPMADASPEFEKFFGTPHQWDFEYAAAQFHLPYAKPEDMDDFLETYLEALENRESCVIEVQTDRRRNVEQHLALREALDLPETSS